jgi:hypothetical protein
MAEQQPETAGSPYAAEFNKLLASDIPLADAVLQWAHLTDAHLSTYHSTSEALDSLSDTESAAFLLTMCEGWDTWDTYIPDLPVDSRPTDSVMRDCWAQLVKARAALRQASA